MISWNFVSGNLNLVYFWIKESNTGTAAGKSDNKIIYLRRVKRNNKIFHCSYLAELVDLLTCVLVARYRCFVSIVQILHCTSDIGFSADKKLRVLMVSNKAWKNHLISLFRQKRNRKSTGRDENQKRVRDWRHMST